jgi:predicted transcriptional regulator
MKRRKSLSEARTVQVGIRVEVWLKHELEEIARREERTITQVARQAFKEYVEHKKTEVAA